ncbi:ABC transporter permease [Pseudoflavitalea rhizosphaerae]|uniref:ABC transporter permease n=1 Tax=Pseudoflavitalea rhizosphaerae TaxID=1884793 RepID=UPI000F8C9053|nr:ABC transporter permease [Pseudoflavitalea rhizosphaerae]
MSNSNSEIIIEAGRTEKNYWQDIWRYRELFYILSWRDIRVRYKQTAIGAAWSVIRPLLTMLIFTFVFGRMAKLPTEGTAPYTIMVFAGLIPWFFFANALSESSQSLVLNSNLITKVYFPRIIIPASSIIVSLVDFFISFGLMLIIFLFYGFTPSVKIFLMPVFLLFALVAAMGAGLLITALNVKFRDFRFVIPFIVQIGLYITPVGYSSSIVPEQYQLLYHVNPMVGVIEGFRWCIIGELPLNIPGMLVSLGVTLVFFIWGISYFRRTERSFADSI